jgi:hypothetical protein
LALCLTAAATEAVPPESETKPAETSGANFWQKLKTKFLKAKEVPVKEETQPAVVEPASVPEAKPEKKESKPGIISKIKKPFWKTSEAKSAEPVAAPVEEAEKAPETGESSAPQTEVCRKLFLQTMNILRKVMLLPQCCKSIFGFDFVLLCEFLAIICCLSRSFSKVGFLS